MVTIRSSEQLLGKSKSPGVEFIVRVEEGDPVASVREDALHEDTLEVSHR